MVNDASSEISDALACEAERLGIGRALSLAPKAARAAIERARQPLPAAPSGPLTEPAGAFDPSRPSDAR